MKLSELYTTGTVAKSETNSAIAYVCTRTLDEMYPDTNMEFDTSILLSNGSTSEMLNCGALGVNFTAYNNNNTLYNGEPTVNITFLGTAIVKEWNNYIYGINLSQKTVCIDPSYGGTWDFIKNARFVTNIVTSDNIDTNNYEQFDLNSTTNGIYNFNSTFVAPVFSYKTSNTQRDVGGTINNPITLTGDNQKRICGAAFRVYACNYTKYLQNSDTITNTYIGILVFVYKINDEYFLLQSPISYPNSGFKPWSFTTGEKLTIGGFNKFNNGISGFLPVNDETKGAFAFRVAYSGNFVSCCNYFVTTNCALYTLNSCGLRWITDDISNITTAGAFRNTVNLGKMSNNGIISHTEWINTEYGIQQSDNPNKDTTYENIPSRSKNDELLDDIDDIELGYNLYGNGFVNYYQVTISNLSTISTSISNETEKTGLLNNVISLKSYIIPTSAFTLGTIAEPIKLNGVQVLESAPKIVSNSMKFHLGDYTISGKYGSLQNPHFLDKPPYTLIELYVPFCGIVQLPDKCMYNTISVDLLSDLYSGGCIAVIKCNNSIVATKTGIIGFDVPLSAFNNAELSHALLNNVMATIPIASNLIQSGATGNINGIVNNTTNGINNIVSMYHTENQNYTSVIGASGGKSEYALPSQCYVKISTKIAKYPTNYVHNVGKPCRKTKKLSDCIGFTVCENVNVNISATGTEKQMIKQLLENGIYI